MGSEPGVAGGCRRDRPGSVLSLEPEWGAAASRMRTLRGPQVDPGHYPGAVGGVSGAQSRAGCDWRPTIHYGPQAEPILRVGLSATFDW